MDYGKAVSFLPARTRRKLYMYLGLASLCVTAALAFFSGSPYTAPWWLDSLLSGIGTLTAPFTLVAANNVQESPAEQAERENRPRDVRGRFLKEKDQA